MSEPTGCCCAATTPSYCDHCDLLVGLEGLHVVDVDKVHDVLVVTMESASTVVGCPSCGVVAESHGLRLTPKSGQVVVWSGGLEGRLVGLSGQVVFVL